MNADPPPAPRPTEGEAFHYSWAIGRVVESFRSWLSGKWADEWNYIG